MVALPVPATAVQLSRPSLRDWRAGGRTAAAAELRHSACAAHTVADHTAAVLSSVPSALIVALPIPVLAVQLSRALAAQPSQLRYHTCVGGPAQPRALRIAPLSAQPPYQW